MRKTIYPDAWIIATKKVFENEEPIQTHVEFDLKKAMLAY